MSLKKYLIFLLTTPPFINISEHIPENCFIDRRKFKSHNELYTYLTNMTKVEYLVIQENIENYLFSSAADPYRAETFANTIVGHVKRDMKEDLFK